MWGKCAILLAAFFLATKGEGPAAGLRSEANGAPDVKWDPKTLHLVATGGGYGRIRRLQTGMWLAAFSRGDSVWASRSEDRGVRWSTPVKVAGYARGVATNSELLELTDGRVMYFYNEREAHPAKAAEPDNGIGLAVSSDGGVTWSDGRRIYGGGAMWEPAGAQTEDGAIHVLFADEKPHWGTGEQQISDICSRDGGATWERPACVSFRARCRDGMPVPLKASEGKWVVAIEDNGLQAAATRPSRHGNFKPAIVEWTPGAALVSGTDPRRWAALAEPLADPVYAGAPYLIRLVGTAKAGGVGVTLLSAQVTDGSTDDRQMVVWTGDPQAKHFDHPTRPFAMADAGTGGGPGGGAEQLWNSLTALEEGRVLAVAGTSIHGQRGIWAIEGRVEGPTEGTP